MTAPVDARRFTQLIILRRMILTMGNLDIAVWMTRKACHIGTRRVHNLV